MMFFSDKFLVELKNDPIKGTILLIKTVRESIDQNDKGWDDDNYQILLEAYALIIEIVESQLLNIERPNFEIKGSKYSDCEQINTYLKALEKYCVTETSRLKVESLRSHFKTAIGSGFSYEFSQGDLERVQVLINKIRDLISQTNGLEKGHQRRLLSRLEKLQSEIHKKVSDLDCFWGLIGDAGVVLGKLGKDAKPIIDCIKEVADIVWQTQSRAEELPSGTQIPMLTNKSTTDDNDV